MELLKKYQKNTLTKEDNDFLFELSSLISSNFNEILNNENLFLIVSRILTNNKIYFQEFNRQFQDLNNNDIFALLTGIFTNEEKKQLISIYALFTSILFNTSKEFVEYMDDHLFNNEQQKYLTQICKNNSENRIQNIKYVYVKIKKFIEKYSFNPDFMGYNVKANLENLNCFIASLMLPKLSKTTISQFFDLDMKKKDFNTLLGGYLSHNLPKNHKKLKNDYEENSIIIAKNLKSKILSRASKSYGKTIEMYKVVNFEENLILNFINEDENFNLYIDFINLADNRHIFLNSSDIQNYKEIKDYRIGKRLSLSFEKRICDSYTHSSLTAIRRWIFNYDNSSMIGSVIFHDDCFLCIDRITEVLGDYEVSCLYPDISNHRFKMYKFTISDLDDLKLLDKSDALVFYNELLHVDSMSMLFAKTT